MNFNIDSAIFIGFLLANLAVGLRYGRGVKTIEDYALGGRNFSTGAIVATIVATWISGSGFFVVLSKTYSDGLSFVIMSSSMGLALLVIGVFLVPKMKRFLGMVSIAEAMGNLYGRNIRIITAVTGTIGAVGGIAVQFKVFAAILNYSIGIPETSSIFISATIIIIYSAFGGIRAVTYTDILQFFTFGFIIPFIGLIIWHQLNRLGINFVEGFQNPLFNYKEVLSTNNPDFWQMIPLMLYFAVPQMGQDTFQRISIGKNIQQVKKAFIIAAILFIVINLATAWIPFLIFNINPGLDPNNLLIYIIDTYSYTGLKGLIIIGILAMSMSTADSDMNASSVLFSNDFCGALNIGKSRRLLISRIFSLVLGMFAVALALSKKDLLTIVLTANSLYMPIVTVPFILTILGFHTTRKAVSVGMWAGFITILMWNIFEIQADGIVFAMMANLIFLLGSHYLLKQPGGWIKDTDCLNKAKNRRNKKIEALIVGLKKFNFIEFSKKTAPKDELMYMGFGIYCILYTFTTMYSTQVELLKENGRIILTIYQIMMCTGTIMAMYPIWPPRIKHEIIVQVAWNIVIFYMLIFFSSFFVMVSNLGQLQFAVFTLNMVIAAILTGWRICLGMVLIGFYLSSQCYKYYVGIDSLDISIGSPQFIFMYALMLAGSALIIFFKPKQEYLEATEVKVGTLENEVIHLDHEITGLSGQVTGLSSKVTDLNEQVTHYSEQVADKDKEIERLGSTAQKILNNVNHELRLPIGNVINFSEMLNETLEKSNNQLVKELSKEVYDNSNRVSTMILNMLDLATLAVKKVDLQKATINFSELVVDRVKRCRKIYLEDKKIDFELTIEPEIMIAVDPNYIRQTIDNLVINSIRFSKKGLIKVSVSRKDKQVIFTITDQGKGIPKPELSNIFTPFKMGSNSESKACGRGVGLALCKSAVEAHGGSIIADSNGEIGAILKFTLPFGNTNK